MQTPANRAVLTCNGEQKRKKEIEFLSLQDFDVNVSCR